MTARPGAPGDRSSSLGWKTSRRSGGIEATALHLVSAFAAGAGLVLGQRGTAEKSNEKTAIPELLSTLALEGATVTIDAMGILCGDRIRARGRRQKTTHEQRLYISSLAPDAARMAATVRAHRSVENRLHWCMDIAFNDDQMRAPKPSSPSGLGHLGYLSRPRPKPATTKILSTPSPVENAPTHSFHSENIPPKTAC